MALDPKTRELAAVAASAAGNCMPCLRYHFAEAKKNGCTEEELSEVIEAAKMIKNRPITEIEKIAGQLLEEM
ncbi:MAG: carboxymuconolactone decarboxylase family protein [Firmicutes bacterium]|nr:carboxymuconolactone decarboxylase family protein [Bacillota bacterium]